MSLRRPLKAALLSLSLLVSVTSPAAAQHVPDPSWPCIQRKVPELAIGQMWAGPIPEGEAPENADEIEQLARRISARRVPVEEAQAAAAEFVDGVGEEARGEQLAWLFAAVLDRINAERGEIIAGIGRYSRRQAGLSDRVEEEQLELAELNEAPDDQKDRDRIEELEDTLAWDTRIYKERAQSLTYVCETPVLLERRAFDLARALAGLT
jgi:hypothetical protein